MFACRTFVVVWLVSKGSAPAGTASQRPIRRADEQVHAAVEVTSGGAESVGIDALGVELLTMWISWGTF